MALNKTNTKKYIQIIKNSKRKVVTVDEVSKKTGEKSDLIRDNLIAFNPLINFDLNYDLHGILNDLENCLASFELEPVKKRMVVRSSEVDKYKSLLDYIYKKMTIAGGMLDLGYKLNKKDIKMLKKLLKRDEDNLKKK